MATQTAFERQSEFPGIQEPLTEPAPSRLATKLIRSQRRRRTIGGRLVEGVVEVRVPARMSESEAQHWVEKMRARFERRQRLAGLEGDGLVKRARMLNRRYFGGKLGWESIRFVANQNCVNGSCSPGTKRIRISDRIARLPIWVVDYVIIHELAHLLHPNHSERFWADVNKYPRAERARGYLMAMALEPELGEPTAAE